jgi:hypothetical protein
MEAVSRQMPMALVEKRILFARYRKGYGFKPRSGFGRVAEYTHHQICSPHFLIGE